MRSVIYLAAPSAERDPEAAAERERLEEPRHPRRAVRRLLRRHREDRGRLREILLTDGVLFEDRPAVARALVAELTLADLFGRPTIHRLRGGRVERLVRDGDDYVDANGVRAKLLLNDRVAFAAADLEPPVRVDLKALAAKTLARRLVPVARDGDRLVLRLGYPDGLTARALVRLEAGRPRVECIDVDARRLARARATAAALRDWTADLTRAAERMVLERPGFDEPKDEPEGEQEDGELRLAWRKAYFRAQRTFTFREESYPVYDYRGNPTPPQVCIDFIFDTIERASGTWYRRRGRAPKRIVGGLDFDALEGLRRRQTPSVLEYAADPSTPLERHDVPAADRVPFRRRAAFAAAVARQADAYREGDVLIIHGLRDEDMEEHFHTVLVLDTDPLTGIPTVVADNAGRPRIRSLASAMSSAPRRSVKHRIRVALPWLIAKRTGGNEEDAVQPGKNSL